MNTIKRDSSATQDYISYAKDIGVIIAAQVFVSLLQFARLPIITKWLGPDLYGTWSIIWVTITLVAPLATVGLTSSIIRFLAAKTDRDSLRNGLLFSILVTFGVAVLFTLVMILSSGIFSSDIIKNPSDSILVKLASFLIITQSLIAICLAYFRALRQMKTYAVLALSNVVMNVTLIVGFLYLGWELTGLIWAFLISDSICIIGSLGFAFKQIGFGMPKFDELSKYLVFGLPLMFNTFILWVVNSSDRYLVGYFMQPKDVGIYNAAYVLAGVLSLALGPVQVVLFPTISHSYDKGDVDKTRFYLSKSLKYLMVISIPAAFGLSALAAPLLHLLTSSEFISGSMVVPFIALGIIFYDFYAVTLYIIYIVKKTYWEVILLSIAAVTNLAINFVLIPKLGILGAAVASFVAYLVLGVLTVIVSFRYLRFNLELPYIAKYLLASIGMAVILHILNPSNVLMVVLSIIIGIVIYVAILFAIKGFSKSEIDLARELVRRYIFKTGQR